MYKSRPASRIQIQDFVRDLRKLIGYEFILNLPIVNLMENVLPTIFPNFNYVIAPKEDMENKHGETRPDNEVICIREDVYIGACTGNGRDRMTIAHEIGHLLLHKKSTVSLCRLDPQNKEIFKIYENPEWQADVFAGELLAPSYLIYNLSPDEIHKQANISKAAAYTQLRHLPPSLIRLQKERRCCH